VILAALADALTLSQVVLGVVVAWLIGTRRTEGAAVALAVAWLTDFLDGRVARMAVAPSRLGAFDMPADVFLGAGVVVGLGLARWHCRDSATAGPCGCSSPTTSRRAASP